MTFHLDRSNQLPQVSIYTALDWYYLICLSFLIAAMIECVFVLYFTKIGTEDVDLSQDEDQELTDEASNPYQLNYEPINPVSGLVLYFKINSCSV